VYLPLKPEPVDVMDLLLNTLSTIPEITVSNLMLLILTKMEVKLKLLLDVIMINLKLFSKTKDTNNYPKTPLNK